MADEREAGKGEFIKNEENHEQETFHINEDSHQHGCEEVRITGEVETIKNDEQCSDADSFFECNNVSNDTTPGRGFGKARGGHSRKGKKMGKLRYRFTNYLKVCKVCNVRKG